MSEIQDGLSEADHLYGTARDMHQSAVALTQRNLANSEKRFQSTLQFLMGFATEIYLKAALAQDGVPSNERFGHDLVKLFDTAKNRGLLEFGSCSGLQRIVEILAPAHKDYSFRYPKPNKVLQVVESVAAALTALEHFDDHLRSNVNVAAATRIAQLGT